MRRAWTALTAALWVGCGASTPFAPIDAADSSDATLAAETAEFAFADPNCGLPGFVTVTLDVGGVARSACVADGPAWGVVEASAATAKIPGDGTLLDTRTGIQWQLQALPGAHSQAAAQAACDQSAVAGHLDWRLPTVAEVMTALDLTHEHPALGLQLQPSPGDVLWTLTTHDTHGWTVALDTGTLGAAEASAQASAWCVRAEPLKSRLPQPRFETDLDGAVSDAWTGLRWQGTSPTVPKTLMYAMGWCGKLNMDGTSWRVPTINELASLMEMKHSPVIEYASFLQAGGAYHTVSQSPSDVSVHWTLDFSSGVFGKLDPDAFALVRCVRTP